MFDNAFLDGKIGTRSSSAMMILLTALLGSLLTALQAVLILFTGDAICIGDGCRIVENLTTVPPLVFHLAGLVFFQAIFWGMLLEKKNPGTVMKAMKVVLLAGMACEGVLVSFQFYISESFCLYCVVILALIVFLNLAVGTRQVGTGLLILASVFVVFSGLQFKSAAAGQAEDTSLTAGTYGLRPGTEPGPKISLFFSSSCLYCEKIIATLKERHGCTVRFQPVDRIPGFDFPGLQPAPSYSPEVNRNFLRTLDIDEIPVLLAKDADGILILKGEGPIRGYLDRNCPQDQPADNAAGSAPGMTGERFIPQPADDSCSAFDGCEESTSRQPAGTAW
ncbi:hypothetical protein JWG42_05815 [Desulfoprunum benzoelyticum]|uniref:Putative membrane protein n=1 Tax=Desulfoprunum benzoelyticum TaxID=1506996 RepID=A0A840URK1_9BACT|nr:hypothetical protein [Desulfoprunum benzoelyticum]MBB5347456.1 putative membrane protein [Desulfoprunum benzoelyticum]MBM9529665.1 hypothetical protein [Desulfoprunum benzoelyticum]